MAPPAANPPVAPPAANASVTHLGANGPMNESISLSTSQPSEYSGFTVIDQTGGKPSSSKRSHRSQRSKVSSRQLFQADMEVLEMEQQLELKEMEMEKLRIKQELERRKMKRDHCSAPSQVRSGSSTASECSRAATDVDTKSRKFNNWVAEQQVLAVQRAAQGQSGAGGFDGMPPALAGPQGLPPCQQGPLAAPPSQHQPDPPAGTTPALVAPSATVGPQGLATAPAAHSRSLHFASEGHGGVTAAPAVTSTPGGPLDVDVGCPAAAASHLNPFANPFHRLAGSDDPSPSPVPHPPVFDLDASTQALAQIGNVAQALKEISHQNLLPPSKISRFNGDILEYSSFKHTFHWKVERNVEDPRERLNQLLNLLDGLPRELVQGCRFMEPYEGYADAWRSLEKEYGSHYKMEKAYMCKLLEWKRLEAKDTVGLKRFGAFLVSIRRAMGANLRTLDAPHHIESVAKKLPPFLLGRWSRVLMRTEERTGAPATFKDLVEFVESEAKVADINSSLFDSDKKGKTEPAKKAVSSTKTFSIGEAKVPEESCKCCKGAKHLLKDCKEFQGKTVKERWHWVSNRRSNVCFKCLKPYRRPDKSLCKCSDCCSLCKGAHHQLLCDPSRKPTKPKPSPEGVPAKEDATEVKSDAPGAEKPPDKSCATLSSVIADDKILLAIVPVRVRHKGGTETETYAFLDTGSQTTLCAKSLARRLEAVGVKVDVNLRTQAGDYHCTERISVTLSDIEGTDSWKIRKVLITEEIAATVDDMVQPEWLQRWPHLADLELPKQVVDGQVEMIIGLNSKVCKTILDVRNGSDDEPSGVLTPLGWVIHGPTGPEAEGMAVNFLGSATDILNKRLDAHYRHDFPEHEVDSKKEMSVEDSKFMSSVAGSIKFVAGQYEVALPFKEDVKLPNNIFTARYRLKGLRRKFERNADYKNLYVTNVEKLIAKGYAELVPASALERNDGKVWYLCHHGVRHPFKPDKLRVVYDCSCDHMKISLNDWLLQGPDLTSSLTGVLLRFKNGEFAIAGDIEEMFHRVRVPEEDRDVLRFLWWPGGDASLEPVEYRLTVHPFGATSSPSCVNFALQQTARDNATDYDRHLIDAVSRNYYVDNFFYATESKETAINTALQMISLCQKGGWRLNQWISNDKDVLAAIPDSERDKSVALLDLYRDDLPVERALGVHWSLESDEFLFKIVVGKPPVTRREVLSLVMSIYDPLGHAAPFILTARVMMQDMCRRGMDWDEHMSSEDFEKWSKWLEELPRLSEFRIPRSYTPRSFGKVVRRELHHFADASQSGYGVVSYLRLVNEHGEVRCAFLMGKSRVAPLKLLSIVRLELTAARVAATQDKMLRAELDVELSESTFWTDSTTVLKYLRNEAARFHTFVANRVSYIREVSPVSAWRYVDSKSNPADLASRGAGIDEFLAHDEWIHGPSFLKRDEQEWPRMPDDVKKCQLEGDPETKTVVAVCATKIVADNLLEKLAQRVSTWPRLVRCIGQCYRFIRLCRRRVAAKKNASVSSPEASLDQDATRLSAEDLADAEASVWKMVQAKAFQSEYEHLSATKPRPVPKKSRISKLTPYLKEDLLRAGGRLARAGLDYDATHPILLPKESDVVLMYARWRHSKLGHCGVDHLHSDLRNKFWIIKGRSLARSVTVTCTKCRRLNPRPITQIMADLPKDRVCSGEPPFTNVGTDCFGPFIVRKGRTDHKRYGLVITCLASRSVHIEVLETMETDSFINGLRRFIARRGPVKSIRSDNGSNFVGAERELLVELQKLDAAKMTDELASQGISWKFNPPYASHFGRVWERMIRSIRRIFRGLLNQQRLTDEVLVTLMCEVESILNSRPLTTISDDPRDLRPLTPAHLLTLRSSEGPPCLTTEADCYSRKRWRQVQYLADAFWRRWVREYLPTLQERKKWDTAQRNLRVDDLVLVADDKLPRSSWLLGRVVRVECDESGNVRKASVLTKSGEILRPISKLCMFMENDSA